MCHYLVTGGAGFIGSWLTERLVSHGNRVTVLDDFSAGRLENIAALRPNRPNSRLRLIRTSTSDAATVERCVAEVNGVYHLASPVGVMRVLDDPRGTLDAIVTGGAVVSSACAKYSVPLLVASSSEVYGISPPIPTPETAPCVIESNHKRWGYAAGKFLLEHQALTAGCPAIVVRLFTVVGPRQAGRYGMVVPRFVKQAMSGAPLTVFGTGEQTRSFMHVREAAVALEALLHSQNAYGETVNVGSPGEVSINELAIAVSQVVGTTAELAHVDQTAAYGCEFNDVSRRVPDVSKLARLIGPRNQPTLEDIIRDVMQEQANG